MVLFDDEVSRNFHKKLFSFDDDSYRAAGTGMTDAILAAAGEDVVKVHIAVKWEGLLAVALWTRDKPSIGDVVDLVRRSGVLRHELAPFQQAEIGDIFPWLFYGRKFDVLRKICNAAKARAESMANKKIPKIDCYLVSDEGGGIVASSV